MLSVLVDETKIMFLRARDPPKLAFLRLALLVAPGFTQGSGTINFLKTKVSSYYAEHRSRLNTEARAYGEDYIHDYE